MAIYFEGRSAGRYGLSGYRIAFWMWLVQNIDGIIDYDKRDFSRFCWVPPGTFWDIIASITSDSFQFDSHQSPRNWAFQNEITHQNVNLWGKMKGFLVSLSKYIYIYITYIKKNHNKINIHTDKTPYSHKINTATKNNYSMTHQRNNILRIILISTIVGSIGGLNQTSIPQFERS